MKSLLTILSVAALLSTNIFSQTEANKKMAVTMDDLPLQRIGHFESKQSRLIMDKLIEKIKSQEAPIVGFVNEEKLQSDGKNDEAKIELLKDWLNAGLDLGNHTYSHKSANRVPVEEYEKDILDGERTIKKLIEEKGKKLTYFRHPYLQTGRSLEVKNEIDKFLMEHNYVIAPVTIDNGEWIFGGAYEKAIDSNKTGMMKRIGDEYISYMKRKLEYWESQSTSLFGRNINHILLIHANTLNADYYSRLCEMIRTEGYKFISLEEALKDEAFKTKDTFIGAGGISWIHRWAVTQGKKKDFFGDEPSVPEYIMKYAEVDSE
ncbi:MAG: polysaccharide deacetylase family protein [Ignavibacteriales bacterium]|nr:polysaccharide deacetylase family protein [Ignavibacteriales bacterium]